MVAKQRIRMANEKHSKNITQRGNVAKTLVRRGGGCHHLHPSSSPLISRRGRRKRNTLLDLGFWHCLCLLSVDQQYFRSSRASGWACDEKSLDSCLMLKVTKDKATNGSWWKPREPINNFVPTEFTLKKRRWLLFFYSVH
ncbi:stress-associated endoplasmic reticulum protein 2 isoform X1 [Hyperolius riggenbachi]|uniref:stress-associated endoplasmic reticulum protein 2 isoform X1 n=1 Tax=Hyperolius riggenbachi TaxID=752182 RepID=UPI0035A2CE41